MSEWAKKEGGDNCYVCVYVFRKGKLQIKKKNEQHGWNRVGTFSGVTCQTLLRTFLNLMRWNVQIKLTITMDLTHIHENSIDRLHNAWINPRMRHFFKNCWIFLFPWKLSKKFHNKNLSTTLPHVILQIIHYHHRKIHCQLLWRMLLFFSAWHSNIYSLFSWDIQEEIGHISPWQLSSLSLTHHHPFHSYAYQKILLFLFHWNAFSDENKNNIFDSYWLIRDPSLSLFFREIYTSHSQKYNTWWFSLSLTFWRRLWTNFIEVSRKINRWNA